MDEVSAQFYILSRASEVGFPTNHLGSGERQDTGQGSFSPLKIEKDGPYTGPVLLRQGEPGTSQYISIGLMTANILHVNQIWLSILLCTILAFCIA